MSDTPVKATAAYGQGTVGAPGKKASWRGRGLKDKREFSRPTGQKCLLHGQATEVREPMRLEGSQLSVSVV